MNLAHDALSVVLAQHAGYLQSFEQDERKRILRSHAIVAAVIEANPEHYNELWQTANPKPTPEALEHCIRNVLPRIHETLERLLRLVPNYVEHAMRTIPSDAYEAHDMLDTFRDQIDIRMELYGLENVTRFLKLPVS